MSCVAPSSPPPALHDARPRSSVLPLTPEHYSRVRSASRRDGRDRSRVILKGVMKAERALTLDVADAFDVDESTARRAIAGAAPVDIGDTLAMAKSGAGGARLARRLLVALLSEVDALSLISHR